MSNISNRDPYWDTLKGLAIVLVLLGHSIQCSCSFGSESCFDNLLYRFIYSFHMPLFMIICGYFYFGTLCRYTTRQVINKKVQSLVVPIVVFGLLSFPIFFSGQYTASNVLHHLLTSMTILWFLCQIVLCSATVLLVNRFVGDSVVVYLLICVLSMFVPNVAGLERFSFMFPMFVIGYYLNKSNLIRLFFGPNKVKTCFILGSAFTLLLLFYNRDSFIYTSKTFLFGDTPPLKQLFINLFRITIGILGSLFVMTFVRVVYEKWQVPNKKHYLETLGRQSMGIYCFQSFFWHFYPMLPIVKTIATKCFSISVLLGLLISLFVCSLLTGLSSRNRVASFLFLGSRI